MKLTNRDLEIFKFLEEVQVAESSSIAKMFFGGNIRPCQRRLKILYDNKYIKRIDREFINQEYIYYLKRKPQFQLEHKLYISRFVSELKMLGDIEIIKIKMPLKIFNVICDGFVAFKHKDKFYQYFIEIELTKNFNANKYIELHYSNEWKSKLKAFPPIVVISNKNFKSSELNIVNVKLDFSNIKNVL